MSASGDDEIALLAHQAITLGERGLDTIERSITRATQEGRWDDIQKWCRVRLRVQRIRQEQRMNDALHVSNVRRQIAGRLGTV